MAKKERGRGAAIDRYLRKITKRIQKNMARERVNATGATSRSIFGNVESNEKGQLEASPVLEKTETGQKPGGRVQGMQIHEWSLAKGIDFDLDTSFRVADKIKLMGTATFRMGGRTDIYTEVLDDQAEVDRFLLDYQMETVLEIDGIFANIAKLSKT